MGESVAINGHQTWIERTGQGTPVLLLHGGFTNSDGLLEVFAGLARDYELAAFDRRGHGRTADTDAPFHYADMADETIAVLTTVVGGAAHLIGFSDGGNAALLVALSRADLVGKMVPIGANFHHDGLLPMPLQADSPAIQMIAQAYGERSPDGRGHFDVVLQKSLAMFSSEPTLTVDDLHRITAPTMVTAGDDDAIRLDHTCALYEALPNGELAIVPGASHLLPIEKPALVSSLILDFLQRAGPPATFMPMRRGPALH